MIVYEVLSAKVFLLNSKLSFLEREGVMIVCSMHQKCKCTRKPGRSAGHRPAPRSLALFINKYMLDFKRFSLPIPVSS